LRRWKADRVSCDNVVDHRLDHRCSVDLIASGYDRCSVDLIASGYDRCSVDLIASGYDRCSVDLIASGYDRCSDDHNHHVDHLGTSGIHAHAGTF
jgi:hypothetical protein